MRSQIYFRLILENYIFPSIIAFASRNEKARYAETIQVGSHTVFIAFIATFCASVGFHFSDFSSMNIILFFSTINKSGVQGRIHSLCIFSLTAIDFCHCPFQIHEKNRTFPCFCRISRYCTTCICISDSDMVVFILNIVNSKKPHNSPF